MLIAGVADDGGRSRHKSNGNDDGAVDGLKVTQFVDANNGTNRTRAGNMTFEILSQPFQPIQNRRIGGGLGGKPILWLIYSRNNNKALLEWKHVFDLTFCFINKICQPGRVRIAEANMKRQIL